MDRIKSNEGNEELYFKRAVKNLPNKLEVNNTPIRQRDHANKENVANPHNTKDWMKQNPDKQ